MEESIKKLPSAVFVTAVLCFVLPWVNFSCQGEHVATFTGLQLVIGTDIQQHDMFGQSRNQKVDPEPLAIVVFVVTICGGAMSFLKLKKLSLTLSVVGVIGFITLLLLKSKIQSDALNQTQGMVQVEYGFGFWLILMMFLGTIVLNGYFYFASQRKPATIGK
jgi:hypothetical protein